MKNIYQNILFALVLLIIPVNVGAKKKWKTNYDRSFKVQSKIDGWASLANVYNEVGGLVPMSTVLYHGNVYNIYYTEQVFYRKLSYTSTKEGEISFSVKSDKQVQTGNIKYINDPVAVVFNDNLYLFVIQDKKLKYYIYDEAKDKWGDNVETNSGFSDDNIRDVVVYNGQLCLITNTKIWITNDLKTWINTPHALKIVKNSGFVSESDVSTLVKNYMEDGVLKTKLLMGYIDVSTRYAYCQTYKMKDEYEPGTTIYSLYQDGAEEVISSENTYASIALADGTVKGDGKSKGNCTQAFLKRRNTDYAFSYRIMRYQKIEGSDSWTQNSYNLTAGGAEWADENMQINAINIPISSGTSNDIYQLMCLFYRGPGALNVGHTAHLKCAYTATDKMKAIGAPITHQLEDTLLIGYVEGLPPYYLNNKKELTTVEDLILCEYEPVSKLDYSTTQTEENKDETTFSTKKSTTLSCGSLSAGLDHALDNTYSTDVETTYSQGMIFKVNKNNYNSHIGFYIYQIPVIKRVHYSVIGANDDATTLYNLYYFYQDDPVKDTYFPKLNNGLEPNNPVTYANRLGDYSVYSPSYNVQADWDDMGVSTTPTFSVTTTTSSSSSNTWSFKIGKESEMDIFKLQNEREYSLDVKLETTTKSGFAVTSTCNLNNSNAEEPTDVTQLSYNMYWLGATDDQDNWWIPQGHENDKPWCVTYKVNSIKYVDPSLNVVASETYTPINENEDISETEEIIVQPQFSVENTDVISSALNCYPNPFNSTTTINYVVGNSDNGSGTLTQVSVYDMMGNLVAVLVSGCKESGSYTVNWDASQYNQGTYLCKMQCGSESIVQQLVLIK